MNDVSARDVVAELDIVDAPRRTGFRLQRSEVYNWGTFHGRIWGLDLGGENALLTGDIGSGKSTIVDAITSLIVPSQKIVYNRAAGADARERTLRTYVLGHYKSERSESSQSARPVPLRDLNCYSVILARFRNDELEQDVTLAQVFWFKEAEGQPARLYVVSDHVLTISEHFTGFGTEIDQLRRRLRVMEGVEIYDSFPPYGAAFRRRFGVDNEQALDLFYQTVSMKSVGNLTDFVRDHMLEAFPVETRITALVSHFDDLSRAHESVLKAREKIELLRPLVSECASFRELSAELNALRACRGAVHHWFATLKAGLLEEFIRKLDADLTRLQVTASTYEDELVAQRREEAEIRDAIAKNGGDRIDQIKREVATKDNERSERKRRAEQYDKFATAVGYAGAISAEAFLQNQEALRADEDTTDSRRSALLNELTELKVSFRQLRDQHDEIAAEIASLKGRRSNIPRRMLDLRELMLRELQLPERALLFAGELIQVRADERAWEGAAERLLHNFGLSLLVPEAHYNDVASWVDRTHLGNRLVYFRVREQKPSGARSPHPKSLTRKLSIKPDSLFYSWLDEELAKRFDYACCDSLDEFRRERRAITQSGQTKTVGERHEKDDRHNINDRSRYILGWSNEEKIGALERQASTLQARMQEEAKKIASSDAEEKRLGQHVGLLRQLRVFESFKDLDWKSLVVEIERLEEERRDLEASSDALKTLAAQLTKVEGLLVETTRKLDSVKEEKVRAEETKKRALHQKGDCDKLISEIDEKLSTVFPRLQMLRDDALGLNPVTLEACDEQERRLYNWLQRKIDNEDQKSQALCSQIERAMGTFRNRYPLDTQEMDATIKAADEYGALLERLQSDDLPKFESRFKKLLNENTIREVANFQAQLHRERQTIRERIDTINLSLHEIDYNVGRYIILEATPAIDQEIRDFQQSLRDCTEGTLSGLDEETYSEGKFLLVKRIIERFKGREGSTELDRRWVRKVTDVRNWFVFSASERWREDNREHEHYPDSGGKSGGQKEKLAYTVLAASLAYQFGLEWGAPRSRSFRFVVIDEAFGRGSDESTRYGLELFHRMGLQLLIITPLQKIHIIEPYVAGVGFVHNEDGRQSMLRNLTIEEYRAERSARAQAAV